MTQLPIPHCPPAFSPESDLAPPPPALPPPSRRPPRAQRARLLRLRLHGAAALDDAALLALLDGDDGPGRRRAQRILGEAGSVHALGGLGFAALRGLGLGARGSARVLAALELGRRASYPPPRAAPIETPAAAHALLAPHLAHAPRERFVLVVLDVQQRPQHIEQIGEGGLQLCPVELRDIFTVGLRAGGAAILVGHNHPSGNLAPSTADIQLTARLVEAGSLLGLPLLDHLIVHGPRFVSMASLGLLGPDVPARRRRGGTTAAKVAVNDDAGDVDEGEAALDAQAALDAAAAAGAEAALGAGAAAWTMASDLDAEAAAEEDVEYNGGGQAVGPPLPDIWRQRAAGR